MQLCFRFQSVWWRLGIVLVMLGLTACAAPAATPIIASPIVGATEMAQDEYQVQVTLMSPVIAGSNPITVQLWDAKTGKPLHDVTVRIAVAEKKHAPTSPDDHGKANPSSHQSASTDHGSTQSNDHANAHETPIVVVHADEPKGSHVTAKPDDHASEKNDTHQAEVKNTSHDADAGHAGKPMTAGKTEGEYVGQVVIPNAGEWLLTVNYQVAGKDAMAMFAVNATRSAETWLVLSGFLGVNLAVIATAGITKRKALKK